MLTIKVADGSVLNPVYVSVSNLARMGESEFDAVMAWVAGERAKRAARAEDYERKARASAEELLVGMEDRHASQEAWVVKNS